MKMLFIVKNTKQFAFRSIDYRYDEWTTRRPAQFDTKVENWQVY